MRLKLVWACVLGGLSTLVSAQDIQDQEGTAMRPVDLYIHSAAKGINQRIETRLVAPGIKLFNLNDASGKALCSGTVDATTKNWVFKELRCASLDIELKNVELKENFRWGVMRHSLAKVDLLNGMTVGIFLHLGNESQWVSENRITPEKIQGLYGTFPEWKMP